MLIYNYIYTNKSNLKRKYKNEERNKRDNRYIQSDNGIFRTKQENRGAKRIRRNIDPRKK